MKNKALFLDFDGVLFNTIKEVYLVNRYLAKKMDFFEQIDKDEFNLFSKYKFLVYNIWMFTYYNPLIFDNPDENKIIETFNSAILKRNRADEEKFCENFLSARYTLIKNHYDFWKNLEEPYDFFFFIKKLFEENASDIVVVSKKNKSSIIERFASYDFKLSSDKIFGEEFLSAYMSKGEFMEEYMDKNNIDEAIFVDDNSNNLNTVNNPDIKKILALWGNTLPDEKGYSQAQAIEEINYFISR